MSAIPNSPLVVSYNGVHFPTETETVSVDIKPVSDSSGRTVKHCVYAFVIKATLGADNQEIGDTTDFTMAQLRKRLTAYAGEFHYENVGLGGMVINLPAGAGVRDVVWGPKPTLLQWKPLGQVACEIVWQVEV